MVQLLSMDQDSNLCLTKDARCLIYMAPASFRQNLNFLKIGARLHSTILASGMWDFNVSNNNFNSGIRFVFLRLTPISDISSANHRRHLWLWLCGTSHRQRFNIRPQAGNQPLSSGKSLSVLQTAKAQKHSWFFTRCQILLLRRSAIRTHLSSHGFK